MANENGVDAKLADFDKITYRDQMDSSSDDYYSDEDSQDESSQDQSS